MELPFRWNSAEGCVRVEVRVNDDPAALGCAEIARGFPYCRATVEHPGSGYLDVLGWVQMLDSTAWGPGFRLDYFERFDPPPFPFAFYGWTPTFLDAPHSDEEGDWDFHAHTFLCGLGGEVLEFRHEARAILGFSWGFSKHDQGIDFFGPTPLSPADWDGHRDYLTERYEQWEWKFPPGFVEDPLQP